MQQQRSNKQITFICLIIAAAFVSSALLFYRSTIEIAASQAETLTGYAVSSALEDTSAGADMATNRAQIQHIDDKYDLEVLFIEPTGKVVCAGTGSSLMGSDVFDDPTVAPIRGSLSADESQVHSNWSGRDALFGKNQCFAEVRYDSDMGLYLVVINNATEIFVTQRQQMASLAVMMILLAVLIIALIAFLIRKYRRRIIELATTDEVTGLANRKSFVESYEAMRRAGDLDDAVMFLLDIDLFKKINDSFGHSVGDEALNSVASHVEALVGESGRAGRWGGDEFIGVMRIPGDAAFDRIRAMIADVASSEPVPGLHVSVSVGATKISSKTRLNDAVELSDEALYQSKKNGRGFLTVYEEGKTPKISYAAETPNQAETLGEPVVGASGDGCDETPATQPVPTSKAAKAAAPKGSSSRRRFFDKTVESLLYAVRWMIPFVAGGGLLIAVAFLIDGASIDVGSLAADMRGDFGSITPLAAALFKVGSASFNLMLPIFAGFLARSISGDDAFMAGFVGGYISSQGSSGFLGAILAGVIAAVVISLVKDLFAEAPLGVRRVAPILVYPVFSLLAMYVLTTLVVDPAVSAFNAALTAMLEDMQQNSVLLGAFGGAMMATDMGGPINKAAYHLGTASIQNGRPDIMAAVMVGGMVPPCGIALSTLLFKHKFTPEERRDGPVTLFLGLSFITEGALPYVLTDIPRVVPSCMAGAAVAGAMSEAFGCTLLAPHGGIFVFPVVNLPVQYIVALVVGSVVTAVVLGLLKKTVPEEDPSAENESAERRGSQGLDRTYPGQV